MKKRILSILLTVCLLMGLLPVSASAASDPDNFVFDISEGTIRILDGNTEGSIKVAYGNGQTTCDVSFFNEVTVTGSFTAENASTPGKSLKVETDQPVNIRIRNLTIDNNKSVFYSASGNDAYEAMVLLGNTKGKAAVTLTLEGTNFLRGSRDCGGIEVGEGHTLLIKGDGTLNAQGYQAPEGYNGSAGAGIGGHVKSNCGTVIIESGTVTAKGGYGAAGIGGGFAEGSVGGNGGNVHITGGTVTAIGGDGAAGIGGALNQIGYAGHGLGGNVTITGGTVNATAGTYYDSRYGVTWKPDAIGGGWNLDSQNKGTGTLTVDGDAWVGLSGGISTNKTLTRGVVAGTVYGNVTLTKNRTLTSGFGVLTIGKNASLTIPVGKTLTVQDDVNDIYVNGTLTNYGTLALNATNCEMNLEDGTLINYGTLTGSGFITPEEKKLTYAAPPSAPEIASVSSNSITLKYIPGAEYSMDGTNWQSSPTFSGLKANTSYTFYARYAGNGFYHPSASSEASAAQFTADNAPAVGEGFSIDYARQRITLKDGYEASWSNFGSLVENGAFIPVLYLGQNIYIRKAASGDTPASPAIANKIPSPPAAPALSDFAYTIDYVNETLWYDDATYRVYRIVLGEQQTIYSGKKLYPDETCYVCKKAVAGQSFESAAAEFSIPARPAAPTNDAYIINYSSEKISFDDSIYEVNKCRIVGNRPFDSDPVSNGDSVTPGGILRIRYKAVVGKSFKSEPLPVKLPARPAAPDSSVCTINYSNETISFDSSYEVNTKADFTGTDVANNGTVTPGTTLYVRQKAAGTSFASAATEVTIPGRPAAPASSVCTINYSNETISFDSSYEVNTKADFTGTDVANNGTVTPGTTLYVRSKVVSTPSFTGEVTAVIIPARPAAPTLRIDNSTECLTIPNGYCYNTSSADDSSAWMTSNGSAVTVAPGSSIYILQAATNSAFKSDVQCLTAPTRSATPTVTIHYEAETLSTTAAMEYSKDSGATWAACSANMAATDFGWNGAGTVTVQFRTRATAENYCSDAQTVPIPARPVTPAPAGVNETVNGKNDGQITGVSTEMEYRQGETGVWMPCTGTAVTGLNPGAYQVRVKATGTSFVSLAADVTIAIGAEKTYTLNITSMHTFADAAYGYIQPAAQAITISSSGNWQSTVTSVTVDSDAFTIGGSGNTVTVGGSIDTWTVQPAAGLAAGSYTATITVTYDGEATATAPVSFTVTKAAQDAPNAPTVKSKTRNSVTLETIPDNANGVKAQYSKDSGTTWQDSPEFTGLSASTEYHFAARYGETDNYAASPVSAELSVTTGTPPSSGGSSTPTYPPTVPQPENGTVTVSPKSPRKGVTVTITPTPEAGYTVEQVLVTDKNGDPVEVINNGDGTYSFTQPAGKVNINVTFMEDNSMLNFFVDVFPGDYYYDAVLWAAENGITGGVDDTHFAPNAPCTRAQIVTFLWRAAGSPEPETVSSFADVPADSYYAKAVAWAVEQGITKGTSDTTFSPNATCTRAQAMTFIYRSEQAQGGGMQGAWMFQNPFSDVDLENYYGEAVMWAVANGVTNGTSDTTFSPGTDCTRAQIVTFLYRCLGE